MSLPAGTDERAVVASALAAGVRVYPLARFRVAPTDGHAPGLVLGYGTLRPADAARGVQLLAAAVRDASR